MRRKTIRNKYGLPFPCAACGKSFVPYDIVSGPRYCSKRCIWKATKGPEFNAKISREARGNADSQRGKGEGKSYRKLYGRHEHRVVAEKMIGRKLLPKEVVHHRDGNHLNNSPENLEVMTQSEHMRRHGLGISGMSLPWKPWEKRKNDA